MQDYSVELKVNPRKGIRDPQSEAISESLERMGSKAKVVGVGRNLFLTIPAENEESARNIAQKLCDSLLVNPILEDVIINILKK